MNRIYVVLDAKTHKMLESSGSHCLETVAKTALNYTRITGRESEVVEFTAHSETLLLHKSSKCYAK